MEWLIIEHKKQVSLQTSHNLLMKQLAVFSTLCLLYCVYQSAFVSVYILPIQNPPSDFQMMKTKDVLLVLPTKDTVDFASFLQLNWLGIGKRVPH